MSNKIDHIIFSDLHVHYAIGFIDMANSTIIVSKLSGREADSLYMIFLNILAKIIESNGGKIVKTFGDGVFFYFPKTDFGTLADFENVISTNIKILKARTDINKKLEELGLPEVDYRISASFGPVSIVEGKENDVEDIFGSTVNTCAKMNRLAEKNSMIVGSALKEKLEESKKYKFTPLKTISVNDNITFMSYSVD